MPLLTVDNEASGTGSVPVSADALATAFSVQNRQDFLSRPEHGTRMSCRVRRLPHRNVAQLLLLSELFVASDIVVLTWPAFFFRVFCMQLALCIELEVLLVFTCSWACASPTAPQP